MNNLFPLTAKQAWVLSTITLSGGLTKHRIERLWDKTTLPKSSFTIHRISNWDSFNMRKTLESLEKKNLVIKVNSIYSPATPYKKGFSKLKPFQVVA